MVWTISPFIKPKAQTKSKIESTIEIKNKTEKQNKFKSNQNMWKSKWKCKKKQWPRVIAISETLECSQDEGELPSLLQMPIVCKVILWAAEPKDWQPHWDGPHPKNQTPFCKKPTPGPYWRKPWAIDLHFKDLWNYWIHGVCTCWKVAAHSWAYKQNTVFNIMINVWFLYKSK